MMNFDYFDFASLIIATLAFLYSYLSNTKSYELKTLYRNEVLQWYSETISVLMVLKIELERNTQLLNSDLLAKLSVQIEIGRFYFPNIDKGDGFGNEKPIAYQGYRNVVLDFLVYSYEIYQREDAKEHLKILSKLQRYFSSYVFTVLNPKDYLKETHKLTSMNFSKNHSLEDLLEDEASFFDELANARII